MGFTKADTPPTRSSGDSTLIVGGKEFPKRTWLWHSIVNGLQTLDYWQNDFNHPSSAKLGLLNAIFSVGQVVGLPLVPVLADGIGRKWTILVGSTLIFAGVVIQTVSVNISMFIAARFIIGLGICYTQSCSPMLVTELSHPQYHGRFTTIYNTLWYLGSIIASWTTYGTLQIANEWSWKAPNVLQAFPSVIQLFFIWLVRESPRYQIVKDRHELARRTFDRFHGPSSGAKFVQTEFREVLETMALEKEFSSSGVFELWRTKGNRHRLLIACTAGFFSQTAGANLVSYYIFLVLGQIGITDSDDQLVLNGCLTIFNMVIATGMAFSIDKFGRRPLFLVATFGMCIAMTGWTVASQQHEAMGSTASGRAVVALIFLFMFFFNLAWSGLLIAYVEISPFYLRSRYLTVLLLFVGAGSSFSQYMNPVALDAITWKYYLCYIIWLAIQCVVVWCFYVETKGRTLEAMAVCFDGANAKVGGEGGTAKGMELLDVIHKDDSIVIESGSDAHVERFEA